MNQTTIGDSESNLANIKTKAPLFRDNDKRQALNKIWNSLREMNCQASTFETELFGLEFEEDFETFLDLIDLKNPNFSRYVNETKID